MGDWREALHARLMDLADTDADHIEAALARLITPDCVWHIARPVGSLRGEADIAAGWFRPLRHAVPHAVRRDDIVIGGTSRTGSGRWLACLGHAVGNFEAPLHGIAAHGKLVFLRRGEFYRLEGDRIAEAYILPDFLDLMRQAGVLPLPHLLGSEILFPAPASHDGVLPSGGQGDRAAALVEAMLADLKGFDPATFESAGQTGTTGYWHQKMLWYGPACIGSNFTYAGFQRDHRIPMLTAFPDRVGGNHFARFGDGHFVCSGGWPSMTMTHRGTYLGQPATGRSMTMRVMDFWRVEGAQIMENWVLLDLIDLFGQMGRDLIAEARMLAVRD